MMVNTTALTPDDVWGRVRAFAEDAARRRQPIHTLVHRVANVITDVGPDSIGRRSARGRTFRARVTKAKVAAAWRALSRGDQQPRGTLTFTRALRTV